MVYDSCTLWEGVFGLGLSTRSALLVDQMGSGGICHQIVLESRDLGCEIIFSSKFLISFKH